MGRIRREGGVAEIDLDLLLYGERLVEETVCASRTRFWRLGIRAGCVGGDRSFRRAPRLRLSMRDLLDRLAAAQRGSVLPYRSIRSRCLNGDEEIRPSR